MCGITAIINKSGLPARFLAEANAIVAHRGPDDEGFLLWHPGDEVCLYAGQDSAPASKAAHQLRNGRGQKPFSFSLWHILSLSRFVKMIGEKQYQM